MDQITEAIDSAVYAVRSHWKPFAIGAGVGFVIGLLL